MSRRPETFRLTGTSNNRSAAERAENDDPITVHPDPARLGWYVVLDRHGDQLGTLSNRHPIAIDLSAGKALLHASVNSATNRRWATGEPSITVRLVTGEPGDRYPAWTPSWSPAPQQAPTLQVGAYSLALPTASRHDRVQLVSDPDVQSAVMKCSIGDTVKLAIAPDHPDNRVEVAAWCNDARIGYLRRDCWLIAAIIAQQGPFDCKVRSFWPALHGRGITLDVSW